MCRQRSLSDVPSGQICKDAVQRTDPCRDGTCQCSQLCVTKLHFASHIMMTSTARFAVSNVKDSSRLRALYHPISVKRMYISFVYDI